MLRRFVRFVGLALCKRAPVARQNFAHGIELLQLMP
jgi:hypothetical protein